VIGHKAKGKSYSIKYKPSHRYPGGSEHALTDGKLASLEFTDESWLGFHGDDVEIVIDLDVETSIKEIEISFLQNQASWIFLPEMVEILASNDSQHYRLIDSREYNSLAKDLSIDKKTYRFTSNFSAQYIRITANKMGKFPAWHPGKGENAWLFVDEVVVR